MVSIFCPTSERAERDKTTANASLTAHAASRDVAMDLRTLIAAVDTVHARDPTTLRRIDASGARVVSAAAALASANFQTHTAYALEDSDDPEAAPTLVHVFTLREDARDALVRALLPLGLKKFRRGREDAERSLGGAVPGPGSDVSVSRSNRGGYQSYADLLDYSSEDGEEGEGAEVREADAVAATLAAREPSPAAADARSIPGTSSSMGRTANALDDRITWTAINALAVEAYDKIRRPTQRERVLTADVYGWLNVNAPGDYNRLHAHDSAEQWSGVLYLQIPPALEGDAGCLGIRSAGIARDRAPTPYFVHRPSVGDLVCFSGATLHCVSAFAKENAQKTFSHAFGVDDDASHLRVSVAFNIE